MDVILTDAEVWQVRAMQADVELLATRLALARELQATALTGMVAQHGANTAARWRVSADGARLERVP